MGHSARWILLGAVCLMLPSRSAARAADEAITTRIDRLLLGIGRLADRLDEAAASLDTAEARLIAGPGVGNASAGPRSSVGPKTDDAGQASAWAMVNGLSFPMRRRFPHVYKIVEEGPESGVRLSVAGMFLVRRTGAAPWLEAVELRLEAPAFDRAGGRLPSAITVEAVLRCRTSQVSSTTVEAEARKWRMVGKDRTISGPPTGVSSRIVMQDVVPTCFTRAVWAVPPADLLEWAKIDADDAGWSSEGRLDVSLKAPVMNAVRDFASRLLAVGVAEPAAPAASAPAGAPRGPGSGPVSSPLPARVPDGPAPLGGARKKQGDAVLHGLRWLAAHQSEDGGWEAAGFDRWCDGKMNTGEKPDGPGKAMYDAGVTGLSLCAFLGAGYTNRGDHEFAKVVLRGLAYLKNVQDPEGCFGPRSTQHYIYNHATAALAMVEAYGMTQSMVFRDSAQKALDFIALARNPQFAWRYGVRPGDNDTSVTGAMMRVLQQARRINDSAKQRGEAPLLNIDEGAPGGIMSWINKVTDATSGRVGYTQRGQGPARPQELVDRYPNEKSESMTAIGLLARTHLQEEPARRDLVQKGVALCLRVPPTWNTTDGSIDMYYWYYATLAMAELGGEAWARWTKVMQPTIVENQRMDGTYCSFKGSWDPVDPWGPDGGRVYSTAILVRCLMARGR